MRAEEPATGNSFANAVFEKLVVRLDKQKDQRSTWAYAALAAIIAISVVKKVFPIPWLRVTYALLGLASVLLLESIHAGDMYEQRIAFLFCQTKLYQSQVDNAQEFMWLQVTWLNYAAITLLLFVAAFLIAVMSGKVDMTRSDNDE